MIRYYSTRDTSKTLISFEEALLKGLAPDGGLYVPNKVPELGSELWQKADSLADIGVGVLSAWLGDEIEEPALNKIVRDALNFPAPVVKLSDDLWVLELFHGPTLSFKDFGARTMARLMQHFLARRKEKRIILVATSGDTGSAVADGFAGMDNIEVVLLYPKDKVSEVQERQLIAGRPGVRSFAVTGDFDDCQRLVKEAFVDEQLEELPLSSANSINIGRLLPQSLYYLWAAGQVNSDGGNQRLRAERELRQPDSGRPRFIFRTTRKPLPRRTQCQPLLPRLLTRRRGRLRLSTKRLPPSPMRWTWAARATSSGFITYCLLMNCGAGYGARASGDKTTLGAHEKGLRPDYDYLACPHTAVGLEGVARYREETGDMTTPTITLACAHPAKFPRAVKLALEIDPPKEEALEALIEGETNVQPLEPTLEAFRAVLT